MNGAPTAAIWKVTFWLVTPLIRSLLGTTRGSIAGLADPPSSPTTPDTPVAAKMCQGTSRSNAARTVSASSTAKATPCVRVISFLRSTLSASVPPYRAMGICTRCTAPRSPSCAADPVSS